MTGKTHKVYAIFMSFIVAMIIYEKGLTEIDYYLALPILIMTAKYGALFPDIDHDWRNVHDKTVPNFIINKIIHLTGGKHRSWQTHSIDILIVAILISFNLPDILYHYGKISLVNKEVMSILMMGFTSGWTSHIFSDMLTSAGVRGTCFSSTKLKFVPKKIGSFRFNTGNEWEEFNYKTIKKLNMVMGTICILYPFIHKQLFNMLNTIVRGN